MNFYQELVVWLDCDMSPTVSHVWTLGPQLGELFMKVVKPLRSETLLEEVHRRDEPWGFIGQLHFLSSFYLLFAGAMEVSCFLLCLWNPLTTFCPFTIRVNWFFSNSMPEETLPALNCFLLHLRSPSTMWENTMQMKIQKTKAISDLCGPVLDYIVILTKQLLLTKMILLKRSQSQSPSLVWSPVIHPSHYTDSGLPGVWAQSANQYI